MGGMFINGIKKQIQQLFTVVLQNRTYFRPKFRIKIEHLASCNLMKKELQTHVFFL